MDRSSSSASLQTATGPTKTARLPKSERRVRFADTMGMELASIFLFDLINHWYITSSHSQKALRPPESAAAASAALLATSNQLNRAKKQQQLSNNNSYSYNYNNNYNYTSYQQQCQQQSQLHQQYAYHLPRSTHNTSSGGSQSNSQAKSNSQQQPQQQPSFICEFTQPISLISFKERVKLNKVQLETCQVSSAAGHVSVSCTIRVLNFSYDKSVMVRYTTDDWHTHTDSLASFKPGSCDGWSDRFTSTFTVTKQVESLKPGQRVIFAIRYIYNGDQIHWDNNGGLNYAIKKLH